MSTKLATLGCHLIMACRNKERAEAAAEKIRSQTGNQNIEIMILDCSSFESVDKFVEEWRGRSNKKIDVLVNNAGEPIMAGNAPADADSVLRQVRFKTQRRRPPMASTPRTNPTSFRPSPSL